MAVEDSARGLRAAVAAGLTTVVITTEACAGEDFNGAAAVLSGHDASAQLSVHGCRGLLLGSQRISA
jgi:beta-phosphoglucomutase-like phosphatase (HAD superfamily)